MNHSFILTICFVLLLSTVGFSQSKQTTQPVDSKIHIHFVPDSFLDLTNNSILKHPINSMPKRNPFLTGAGYLLQGLKFSSSVDQFNAVAPFDFRAFEPLDYISYSEAFQKNQLVLNSVRVIK